MFASARSFLSRHPYVRDALIWALPAILIGAFLRLCFLSYSPYAYWGSDSKSYFSFAHKLVTEHYISLDEKRRFLYPILMAPIAMLPGATLKWVAILQHAFGLLTLIPLAYICRRTLVFWKWLVIPVTVAFAGFPLILWYEHELLGETVFFATLLWAFAGWVAWVSQSDRERYRSYFWWFFVPFAGFILTKPSGRFVWPGIFLGLLMVGAWRKLERRHWIALGVLVIATLTVGSRKQGAWLLYVATFPLTQVDSPLHAEYKAEIRDMVTDLRSNIGTYYLHDDVPFAFLEEPTREFDHPRPKWAALGSNSALKAKIYMDLAIEGIRAEPMQFLWLGWQRAISSINPSEFKEARFTSAFYPDKLAHHYEEAMVALSKGKTTPFTMLFGFPKQGPLPPFEEFRKELTPAPGLFGERVVVGWVRAFEAVADIVALPSDRKSKDRDIAKTRILPLGICLVAGMIFSFLPRYRRTLGVWTLASGAYLAGVFLVSQTNPRYFCAGWAVLIVLLAVPLDVVARSILALVRRKHREVETAV